MHITFHEKSITILWSEVAAYNEKVFVGNEHNYKPLLYYINGALVNVVIDTFFIVDKKAATDLLILNVFQCQINK